MFENNEIVDLESIANKKVVQIITTNCEGKISETETQGMVTGNFVKGLNGEADVNKDGLITGTELGVFVQGTSKNRQISFFGRLEGDGEIFF